MAKQGLLLGLVTLALASCSDDHGAYVYRPAGAAPIGQPAAQGNAANDALRGGLPAGAEIGGGAVAEPRR